MPPRIVSGEHVSSEALYFGYGANLSSSMMALRCPQSVAVGLGFLPGWTWLINELGYANVAPGARTGEDAALGVYGVLYRLTEPDEARLDRFEDVPHSYEKMLLDVQIVNETKGKDGREDGPAQAPGLERQQQPDGVGPRSWVDTLTTKLEVLQAQSGEHDVVRRELRTTVDGGASIQPAGEDASVEGATGGTDGGPRRPRTTPAIVYVDYRIAIGPPRPHYIGRINTGIEEASAEWGLPESWVEKVIRPSIPFIPVEERE